MHNRFDKLLKRRHDSAVALESKTENVPDLLGPEELQEALATDLEEESEEGRIKISTAILNTQLYKLRLDFYMVSTAADPIKTCSNYGTLKSRTLLIGYNSLVCMCTAFGIFALSANLPAV